MSGPGIEERIASWLAARLGTGRVDLSEFRRHAEGFSWQTFTFLAAWADDEGAREAGFALRREPEDGLLAPYDAAAEYDLHRRLAERTDVPLPGLRWLETDPEPLGRPFYVMDRVVGPVPVPWQPDDPEAFPDEVARARVGAAFVDVLARIHAAGPAVATPVLWSPSAPERTAAETIDLWREIYLAQARAPIPMVERAIAWLRANECWSGRLGLCHGDYRIGNVMLDGAGGIRAVFDWELAHLGDPVQDVAWAALRLFRGRSPLWSHLLAEREFLAAYAEASGVEVTAAELRFWTILNYVKVVANYLRATSAFEGGRSGDLRLAAMGHQVDFVLRLLRDELRAA